MMIKTFQERYAESTDKTLSCCISEEIDELRARVAELEQSAHIDGLLRVRYSEELKQIKEVGKLGLDALNSSD